MNRLLIALCCVLSFAIPALAAPGEPRFLQGTVEWPAALNGEPVMIVRGDDGRVYAVDVSGARRQGAEAVRVGGRVALLVIEGARAYDVTAIVVGAGDVANPGMGQIAERTHGRLTNGRLIRGEQPRRQ